MNPELQRQLWLELSPHRLIAAPIVLLLVFSLVASIAGAAWRAPVGSTALGIFGLVTVFWGTRLASDAMAEEVRSRTWDLQRMSALSPWSLAWGKLAGAPVFAWYIGVLALLVFAGTSEQALPKTIKLVALLVMSALIAHAVALALTVVTARRMWTAQGRQPGIYLAMVLLMVGFSISLPLIDQKLVVWYGVALDSLDFLLFSALIFLPWAIVAAWRALAAELQVRTTPVVWLAFLLFASLYLAGLNPASASSDSPFLSRWSIAVALLSLGMGYLMLLSEASGAMVVRRLLFHFSASHWRRVAEALPCWAVAFALALVAGLVFWMVDGASPLKSSSFDGGYVLTLLAILACRDAAILYFFALGSRPRRVEMTAVVYVLMLDWVIPGILGAMDMVVMAGVVFPVLLGGPHAVVVGLVQLGIALALCVMRWRKQRAATG